MKRKTILILGLILLFSRLSFTYDKPEKITFVSGRSKAEPEVQWLIDIYSDAFAELDIEFEFLDVPPRRAILFTDIGEVDGDAGRIYNYADFHPNLIRVEEHTRIVNFVAYSMKPEVKLKKWESLIDSELKVDYRLGVKIAEINLTKYMPKEHVAISKNVEEGIRKLMNNRIDIYIDIEDSFETYKKSEKFKQLNIQVHKAGVMQAVKSYPFINIKHKELAPLFAEELRKLKLNGTFQKYKEKYNIKVNW